VVGGWVAIDLSSSKGALKQLKRLSASNPINPCLGDILIIAVLKWGTAHGFTRVG
jgi:hypothetical protein